MKQRVLDIQAEISALNYKVEDEAIAEIQELPTVLGVDEHIKALTSGLIDKKTWLIVCTNKRVLMLDKGIIYGLELIVYHIVKAFYMVKYLLQMEQPQGL